MKEKEIFAKWVLIHAVRAIKDSDAPIQALLDLMETDSYLMEIIRDIDEFGIELVETHLCEGCED